MSLVSKRDQLHHVFLLVLVAFRQTNAYDYTETASHTAVKSLVRFKAMFLSTSMTATTEIANVN